MGMDTVLDWAIALLPTFLSVVAMWFDPPRKRHPSRWRLGLLIFGLCITALTLWQQQRQRDASDKRAGKIETMLKSAEERQQLTQQKLDESIQREQRLNDQNSDLHTDLRAQNELLQIMKQSLPPKLQKKADDIHKHYTRELYESVHIKDNVSPPK